MRAAVATRLPAGDLAGSVEVVEVPEPIAGPGEVLVTMRAASLNHHDLWSLRGAGRAQRRLPLALGSDLAGVTPHGREVIAHALVADATRGGGDELLDPQRGLLADKSRGCLAEVVAIPQRNLVDKPRSLSFEEAACLPVAWLTAYRMLFVRADLRKGQTILVQGAGGGVATAALLLAKAADACVWVAGRNPTKLDRARQLGADAVFVIGERLPHRVDAVIDTVGGSTWDHSIKALRPGGVLVVAGSTAGATVNTDLHRVFLQHLTIAGSSMGRVEELAALARFCDSHELRPVIDTVYQLSEARTAFARLEAGQAFGKLVVVPALAPAGG